MGGNQDKIYRVTNIKFSRRVCGLSNDIDPKQLSFMFGVGNDSMITKSGLNEHLVWGVGFGSRSRGFQRNSANNWLTHPLQKHASTKVRSY